MNFYQELTLIKSPDISLYFIWSKLYTQVHLALVEAKNPDETVNIGVSFPEYACFEKDGETVTALGSKLRVFAQGKEDLEQLDLLKWCERLLDYIHIKKIAPVPDTNSHLRVKRLRQVKNQDAKTRSFASKRGLSFEQVKKLRIQHIAKKNNISLEQAAHAYENPVLEKRPYIRMHSLRGGNAFSLTIDQTVAEKAAPGTFNTYGMSMAATVPHW